MWVCATGGRHSKSLERRSIILLCEGYALFKCFHYYYCSRSVGWLICDFVSPHVFSLTVAAVDAKRGYVGMCNGRSAHRVWSGIVQEQHVYGGGQKLYIIIAVILGVN